MSDKPTTEGELFDYLHARFGIGDFDDAMSTIPLWKARANEIGKLKAMMRRRKTSIAELTLAADYAVAHNKAVPTAFALLGLISLAKREARPIGGRQDGRQRLATAAGEAAALGKQDWAIRLYSTDPSVADDVLKEWEASK